MLYETELEEKKIIKIMPKKLILNCFLLFSNSPSSLVSITTSTDPVVHSTRPLLLPSQASTATNVYEYFQLSGFPTNTNLYDGNRMFVTSNAMASHHLQSSSSLLSSSSSAFVSSVTSQDTSLSSLYSGQLPPWSKVSGHSSSSSGWSFLFNVYGICIFLLSLS